MSVPRQSPPVATRPRRGSASAEILLGLLIVILAGGVGLEIWRRVDRQRRCAALVADLQAFAPVIERYAATAKEPGRGAEEPPALPPVLDAALRETRWHAGTPFGGAYEWIPAAPVPGRAGPNPQNPGAGPAARARRPAGAIALTAYAPDFPLSASRADLRRVDAALDDGNLATGRFRTGFNGWPVYTLAEK